MKDFKKAILASISVFLVAVILSSAVILPLSKYTYSAELEARDRMAGTIDYMFLGASHCQQGMNCSVINERFGVNSYNLSGDAMTVSQKKYILEHELSRNNVDTVVLEISYDTMRNDLVCDYTDNNVTHLMRLDNLKERLRYWFFETNLKNKVIVYAMWMISCAKSFVNLVLGRPLVYEDEVTSFMESRGCRSLGNEYEGLAPEDVEDSYQWISYWEDEYLDENIDGTSELIEMAKSSGARVIVIVVPVADSYIWAHEDLDIFHNWLIDFCNANDVEMYDFSLYKDKTTLLPDETSYSYDYQHLCGEGAITFSNIFCDVMTMVDNGEDVSGLFYFSYEEALVNSRYWN